MMDLSKVKGLKDVLSSKVISKIEDTLGNIIYEAIKKLTVSGLIPLKLDNTNGEDLVNYKVYGTADGVGNGPKLIPLTTKMYSTANLATVTFDEEAQTLTVTNTTTMWGSCRIRYSFKKGKTYTVTAKIKETNSSTGARIMIPGGVFNNSTAKYSGYGHTGDTVSLTFVAEKTIGGNVNTSFIGLYPYGTNTEKASATFSEITVIEGTLEKPYVIPIAIRSLNMCEPIRKNTSTVYSGVTQDIDENGVITYNGKATATSFPSYAGSATFFLPKGKYTLCGNLTGRAVDASGNEVKFSFFIQEDDSGKAVTLGASSDAPVRFTTTQDWNCKMYVYISKSNVTLDNVKYYPMLVKGYYYADTMPEFEPYKDQTLEYIHLSEPLREGDYIDFENQKLFRNGDTTGTDIDLPSLKTLGDTCYFDLYTGTTGNGEVTYIGK